MVICPLMHGGLMLLSGDTNMGTDKDGDQGPDKVRGLLLMGYMFYGLYSVQCSCPHQFSLNIESW